MIELIIFNYLKSCLKVPVLVERNDDLEDYVYIEKIYNKGKYIKTCNIAIQSYGKDFISALKLNEEVKEKLLKFNELNEILNCELINDYLFNDLVRKKHRYQALFEISYY